MLQPVVVERVHMHVPQPRHQRSAGDVDVLGVLDTRELRVRRHAGDAIAVDDDRHLRPDRSGLGVEQPRVLEDDGSRWAPNGFGRQVHGARGVVRSLGFEQLGLHGLEALPDHHEPAAALREKLSLVVGPPEIRRESQAVRRIENHPLRPVAGAHREVAHTLQARFTLRQ